MICRSCEQPCARTWSGYCGPVCEAEDVLAALFDLEDVPCLK